MKNHRNLLFLSNGHGEDQTASLIIRQLIKQRDDLKITAMPIVGEGTAYEGMDLELIHAGAMLPSGGFMRLGPGNFFRDLRKGLIRQTLKQIALLRGLSPDIDMVFVCGDVFLLIMAGLFVRKPAVFYAAAKSELINGHFFIEKLIIRALALKVFTRDAHTAQSLQRFRIPADFAGNPVVDAFEAIDAINSLKVVESPRTNVVGFLPGSRDDSYENILVFLDIIEKLKLFAKTKICCNISFFSGLSMGRFEKMINKAGEWRLDLLKSPKEDIYRLCMGDTEAFLVVGKFGELVCQSDIIVGLSGTGNEQAAACGKPVVAFATKGSQYNKRFIASQKKLLGGCLEIVRPIPGEVAAKVLEILGNDSMYKIMSDEGIARMGMKGGSKRIAEEISRLLA